MNQSDFARELGRSIQSLQGYERGRVPPGSVVDRLKALAKQHHRADLIPLIESYCGIAPKPSARRTVDRPGDHSGDRQRLHDFLDEVLDSGDADAALAAERSLTVFVGYVRNQRPKTKEKKA
jgi:transcriptional regulator with XRE-family HTH domain